MSSLSVDETASVDSTDSSEPGELQGVLGNWNVSSAGRNAHANTPPGIATFKDAFHMFFMDSGNNNGIMHATSPDGANWASANPYYIGFNTSAAPGAAVFQNVLDVFFRDGAGNGLMYVTSTDGKTFQASKNWHINLNIDGQPSAATMTSGGTARICVVAVDHKGKGIMRAVSTDNVNWNTGYTGRNTSNDTPPSIVVFKNQFHVFYKDGSGNGILHITSSDGITWSQHSYIGYNTSAGPSAVVFQGMLYVFFRDGSGNGILQVQSSDGVKFSPPKNWYIGMNCDGQPSVANLADNQVCVAALKQGTVEINAAVGTSTPRYQNPLLTDVLAAFNGVPKNGTEVTRFKLNDDLIGKPHIQGMARYSNFALLTHNRTPQSPGYFVVGNWDTNSVNTYDITVAGKSYSHPGGLQVIGDFAVVGIEPTEEASTNSVVQIYSLSTLRETGPVLLPGQPYQSLTFNNHGAACVGMTYVSNYYLLTVYSSIDQSIYVYKSNAVKLGDPGMVFSFSYKFKGVAEKVVRGYDNLALFTDTSQNVYMVGMRGDETNVSMVDYMDLYKIPLSSGPSEITAITTRNMVTYGGLPKIGPHFRYGAGASVVPPSTMRLCCSSRTFSILGTLFNTFNGFNLSEEEKQNALGESDAEELSS